MEAVTKAKEIERLLAEGEWIRGLAAGLLGDPNRADDLAQETYLAALRHPVQGTGSLRPWLATVARNAARMLHRSEGARRSRETELARDRQANEQRSPEEWLEQLETQELLSRLVRELPADLSEVLRMHYFDGMALNAIANQLGLPAGTVRWRKKRALECLKERLDQTHGGDRQAWLSALAPLAVPRWRGGTQAAASGAATSGLLAPWIAMTLTWKLTSLVLLAALIALPFVLPGESLSVEKHAPLQAPAPADLVQDRDLGPKPPKGESLESKVAQAGQRSPVQGPAPSADPVQPITRVRMRVVDFQGAPVAGATVNPRPSVDLQNSHGELLSMGSLEAALFASQMRRVTGSDGVAAWESDLLREDGVVDFRVEGPRLGIGELTAALEVGADVDLGDVMLSRSGGVEGRVQDADGRGLKTKRVALCPVTRDSDGQEVETELTLFSALDLRGTRSGRLGKYRMLGVPPGEYRMWTQDKGDGPFYCSQPFTVVEGLLSQRMDIRVVSESAQAEPASLRILGADGKPLASAFVVLKGEFMSSSGLVGEDGRWGTSQNLLRFAGARLQVHDRSFRHASHAIASLPKDMGALVIQLEAVPHVVRTLQVQDTQGQPIESVVLGVTVEGGEGSMEERSGSAELSLPDPSWGTVSITVQAQGHLIREFEVADAGSLPEPWVIELRPAPGIRGTVVTPGKSRVRAEVRLLRQVKQERVSRKGNAISRAAESPAEKEDCAKDGTFLVNHPHDGAFVLIASARGFADALTVLPDYKAAEGQAAIVLEMNGGGELHGTVLDALGQPVPRAFLVLNHEFHKLRRKRAGKDGSFRFSGVPEGDWVLRTVEDFDSEFFGSTIQVAEDWKFPMNCQVVAGEVARFDLHLPDPNGSAVRGFWSGEGDEAKGWTVLLSTSYGGIFGGDPFATRWSEEQPLVAGREFEFGVQRDRDYYVQLKAEGLAGMLSREILASDLPAQLDPPSRFTTLRTALPGDGAPRVTDLTLEWNQGPWALRTYLTANEDGTFGPTLVPVGSLDLTWQIPGADRVEGRTVEAAGDRELVIEL